uniref:Uncharacterized protein n=1 Tax=Rhizophora mucronata TaxID=61149 RepID=A0A2P2MZZ8_RHIMU
MFPLFRGVDCPYFDLVQLLLVISSINNFWHHHLNWISKSILCGEEVGFGCWQT